ncbi:DUF397 domain-containing protein [Streptomyces noursei]|uniref:DUF397 domain-containing protein n=1 Tax=Streptomyces noursei TaxID=1971 RepID=UPI0036D3D7B4
MTTEHRTPETESTWRKSSYSGNQGGACVEVRTNHEAVGIRDSKDLAGPQLSVSGQTWATFLSYAADHTV